MIHLIHCLILSNDQESSSPQHHTMSFKRTQPPSQVLWSFFCYTFISLLIPKHNFKNWQAASLIHERNAAVVIFPMDVSAVKMLKHWTAVRACQLIPLQIGGWFLRTLWEGERDSLNITGIPPWLVDLLLEQDSKADPHVSAHPLPLLSSSQLSHPTTFYRLYKTFLIQRKLQCMSEYSSNSIFHCPEFMKSTVSSWS